MKKLLFFCTILTAFITFQSNIILKKVPRILVFSKTKGFRHNSIEAGKTALIKIGKEKNFVVDTTENAALFTSDLLKKYAAVVFLNTTGDVLDNQQQTAFENYIKEVKEGKFPEDKHSFH